MEKTFALADHHPNEGKTAVYRTLDSRVVFLIFLKKTEWPNRAKEEVFRCPSCKGFTFPKEIVRARGKDYKHICTSKGSPRPALEPDNSVRGESPVGVEKGVSNERAGVDASPELA